MKKDDAVYLHHILAAIERIEAYSEGVSFQEFLQTEILQDGVIRQLEIIGEATRKLSTDLSLKHPEVPGVRSLASETGLLTPITALIWE